MRSEAKEIYAMLLAGKSLSEIEANHKTKSKVNRIFLYRKLIDSLLDDIQTGKYTFSTYDLQNMLKRKKDGR